MDCQDYITVKPERKKGEHLRAEERGAIKVLVKQGSWYTSHCASQSVAPLPLSQTSCSVAHRPERAAEERHPATPPHSEKRSIRPTESVCRKPLKAKSCKLFIAWVVEQVREHKWSLDSCCGYARLHRLYHEMRWSAPVLFTTWYGPVCFPSHPLNCPKP
jgi:IS30 family transposase